MVLELILERVGSLPSFIEMRRQVYDPYLLRRLDLNDPKRALLELPLRSFGIFKSTEPARRLP